MKYDYSCECGAEKYPLIERVVGALLRYDNKMFKAQLDKDCIREHDDDMKAEEGY